MQPLWGAIFTRFNMAIPVYIITGFLGAGKTTYINRLIANQDISQNSIIIVNDFGSINIDADLIEYEKDKIIKLTNGCICCTISDSLDKQLESILKLSDNIKDIYMETSGVANPAQVANMVSLSNTICLNDIICLIDASQIRRFLNDNMVNSMWIKQVQTATHMYINRNPDIHTDIYKHMQQILQNINPNAPISVCEKSEQYGTKIHSYTIVPPNTNHNKDFKSGVTSFTIGIVGSVDTHILETLLQQYSDVLLRAKGILQVQDTIKTLQVSGNTISWHPTVGRANMGQLICIGKQGERLDMLKQQLLQV